MLSARKTRESDIPDLVNLFNHTVRIGGTTAHEDEWDYATFKSHYFDDPAFVHTVLNGTKPVGFQAVFALPQNGLAIGSFTDQKAPVRGAGTVLFNATKTAAIANGFAFIDAKIRADNAPGLAYYSKMGFVDHHIDKGVPLKDGTPLDRVTKRLTL
ncbi:L-amino acid N-acyltransferase YncA [Loktanella ponticola]|uniref:L-amino acid N-acyltransferase YncA n=1 Tax=Yoonia ponticola TaxID=1524255 RepID=A0A7W9EYM2_9RHOB|nr:GNAT family N-acetyltransferase [Yoonia ponticola]MBB5721285.1 L-amino acid N-acyltransferase YncA [Yoonia ponticola]